MPCNDDQGTPQVNRPEIWSYSVTTGPVTHATTAAVIASEAKPSRATYTFNGAETLDCFAALAMTAATHRSAVGVIGIIQ